MKLNDTGKIEWEKCYGGSKDEVAFSIEQTSDGGYIVAGNSNSTDGDVTGHHGGDTTHDYWIIKIDSVGNLQWEKSLGGGGDDEAECIQQTTDGGYIISGITQSSDGDVTGNIMGCDSYWIVKLDAFGNIQWEKPFGGLCGDAPLAWSVKQTIDGGFIVGGSNNYVPGVHGGA